KLSDASIVWTANLGASVSWSTPWIDFAATGFMYVADLSGKVSALDTATGTVKWQKSPAGTSFHGSPIVYNNILWIGGDDGRLYRMDATTGDPLGSGTSLCLGTCGAFDQIWSGGYIDTVNNKLLIGVNKRLISIDVGTSGCDAAST